MLRLVQSVSSSAASDSSSRRWAASHAWAAAEAAGVRMGAPWGVYAAPGGVGTVCSNESCSTDELTPIGSAAASSSPRGRRRRGIRDQPAYDPAVSVSPCCSWLAPGPRCF